MRAGKQASLRSLRLREADRAPANAGARLRLRAEVRRSCADRNPSRPPRRIAASLRHCAPRYGVSASPWSCAPLRRRSGIAPVPRTPPATAYRPRPGVVPRCDGAPTSLWSCASATAYRHRSGAASPATAFRPCSGGHDLCPDAALRRCTPTGDHDSRPGDHDSRSGVAPPVLGGFPAAMPRPTLPWGPRSSPGGVRDAKTVGFGRWRSKQTVFRGLGSEKWTFLSVVRVGAFR